MYIKYRSSLEKHIKREIVKVSNAYCILGLTLQDNTYTCYNIRHRTADKVL